jgi:glycosyltransferase involved in cell wall biosynthesis
MFDGIICVGWIHHKNRRGLELMAEFLKIPLTFLPKGADPNNSPGNLVIVTDEWRDRKKISKQHVMFGPHMNSPIFLGHSRDYQNFSADDIFNCLCQWNINVMNLFDVKANLVALPFPVDVQKFSPSGEPKTKTLLMIKNRDPKIADFVRSQMKFDYTFVYGHYKEEDYLKALWACKFGCFIHRHESQGYAIQEAWACDVPLIVWDVKSQAEEIGVRIFKDDSGCGVTSVPYWDERCGIKVYTSEEFLKAKHYMETADLSGLKPREFVLENLSVQACLKKWQNVFTAQTEYFQYLH